MAAFYQNYDICTKDQANCLVLANFQLFRTGVIQSFYSIVITVICVIEGQKNFIIFFAA